MPGQHATLSPSASERWIACPASVRMQGKVPAQAESAYAAEGTAAHAYGELRASYRLGRISEAQYHLSLQRWRADFGYPDGPDEDMEEHIEGYVDLLLERMKVHPNTQLLLEQKVDTGLPHCTGTADAILVSPEHVEIVDLKYGQGVQVDVEDNSQLKLYGVGALETIADLLGEVKTVYTTVYQPRLNNVGTAEIPASELRKWRDDLLPVALEALGPDAHFGPSEAACRWCPASGLCPAQLEAVTSIDFGTDVDLLSPEELRAALELTPAVRDWLHALEERALHRVYSEGQPIPGWKVVMSGGRRFVADKEGIVEALSVLGYEEEQYLAPPKVVGITALTKLVGRKQFEPLLGCYIGKSTGKPSLVPEDDRRMAANPNTEAMKEFEEEEE